jgi:hypothetical protein
LILVGVYEVITASVGNSWMFEDRVPHILDNDFAPKSAVFWKRGSRHLSKSHFRDQRRQREQRADHKRTQRAILKGGNGRRADVKKAARRRDSCARCGSPIQILTGSFSERRHARDKRPDVTSLMTHATRYAALPRASAWTSAVVSGLPAIPQSPLSISSTTHQVT